MILNSDVFEQAITLLDVIYAYTLISCILAAYEAFDRPDLEDIVMSFECRSSRKA